MADETNNPSSIRLAPGVFIPPAAMSFLTSRSSGPGGQNVNKRDTKVELRIAISEIPLRADARGRLRKLAGSRLTEDGLLQIVCEETRSQRQNRAICISRLSELVARSLEKPKPRRKTKPTKSSVRRRLDGKTKQGQRKKERTRNNGHRSGEDD